MNIVKIYFINILHILYYVLVVAFIVPLIIMIIAYVKVGVSLHQSVKEARAISGHTNRWELKTNHYNKRHKKVRIASNSLWGETQTVENY